MRRSAAQQGVGKHLFDLGGEELVEAAVHFVTTAAEDTSNSAQREAMRRLRRLEALDRLGEMGAAGDFDELMDRRANGQRCQWAAQQGVGVRVSKGTSRPPAAGIVVRTN